MSEVSLSPKVLSCGHEVLEADQCHYCSYIQNTLIDELVEPKYSDGSPREYSHPDEFQFILVHQSCELSFKGCLFEMDRAIAAMSDGDSTAACDFVSRCRSWLQISTRQLQHLVDHLTPEDFSFFRDHLSPASGAESIRFRLIELKSGIAPNEAYVGHRGRHYTFRQFLDRGPTTGTGRPKTRWWTEEMSQQALAPSLRSAFVALAQARGVGLRDLNDTEESEQLCLQLLTEESSLGELSHKLVRLEHAILSLRRVHINAAIKHISETPGTGHTDGVLYLRSVLEIARCFPALYTASERLRIEGAE